jgi:hypothetical protein
MLQSWDFFSLSLSQEYFGPERKGRISLDVDIEGPVLLIPKHAFSPDLMVGDIGHVKVTNSTRYMYVRGVSESVIVITYATGV